VLGNRTRGLAVDRHLQIVHRLVGRAVRVAAQRVVGGMLGRVPALDRQIGAPDEGERVVDRDDLLVVGAADRMLAVEAELDARMLLPIGRQQLIERGARPEQERDVPDQQVDVKVLRALRELRQEPPQLGRRVGRIEKHPLIEVPADDHDPGAGLAHRVQ
jgi:hypothetical protein